MASTESIMANALSAIKPNSIWAQEATQDLKSVNDLDLENNLAKSIIVPSSSSWMSSPNSSATSSTTTRASDLENRTTIKQLKDKLFAAEKEIQELKDEIEKGTVKEKDDIRELDL